MRSFQYGSTFSNWLAEVLQLVFAMEPTPDPVAVDTGPSAVDVLRAKLHALQRIIARSKSRSITLGILCNTILHV
jgi:hypothetical protein